MKHCPQRIALTAIAAIALSSACGIAPGTERSAVSSVQPHRYRIFVDESASAVGRKNPQWDLGVGRLCTLLSYGDASEIYMINDSTKDNAPLFRVSIPQFPANGSMDEQILVKKQLVEGRRKLKNYLNQAIHVDPHKGSKTSDILGFIERSAPDAARKEMTVLFTDGLESADRSLNFEKKCVARLNLNDTIPEVAKRRLWSSGALRGQVHFVLPDRPPARKCNSTRELEEFYRVLVKALGAELTSFQPYLTL